MLSIDASLRGELDDSAIHETERRNREAIADRLMHAHTDLDTNNYSRRVLNQVFSNATSFASSIAVSRDRNFAVSQEDEAILDYSIAALMFKSSTIGNWLDSRDITLSFRAGIIPARMDTILEVLRTQYGMPGILRDPEELGPHYERNIGEVARERILASSAAFYHERHWLPVDETRWPEISAPFHQAITETCPYLVGAH